MQPCSVFSKSPVCVIILSYFLKMIFLKIRMVECVTNIAFRGSEMGYMNWELVDLVYNPDYMANLVII